MKVGRKLVVLAGLVALACALALAVGTGQAKAQTQSDVNNWLQSICVVGGQAYLIDDIWEGEAFQIGSTWILDDCPTEVEEALAFPDGNLFQVCVDNTTYLWAEEDGGDDWLGFSFDVNSVPGNSAVLGACPSAPRPPDTMPDCSNKFQVQPDFHQIGDPNVFPDSFTFVPPYRSPYAVPVSKVPDSGNPMMSNLAGTYVEVCNLDTGFTPGVKPTQTFVDLDGNPIPPVAPYVKTDPTTGKLVPKPGILEVAS